MERYDHTSLGMTEQEFKTFNQWHDVITKFHAYNLEEISFLPIVCLKYLIDNRNGNHCPAKISDGLTWAAVKASVELDDPSILRQILTDLEQENPKMGTSLSTILNSTLKSGGYPGRTVEVLNDLSTIDFSLYPEKLGDLVDDLLHDSFKYNRNKGERYQLPKEVIQLVSHFLPKNEGAVIFNPYSGFGEFAVALPEYQQVVCQELQPFISDLTQLRCWAWGKSARRNISDTLNPGFSSNKVATQRFDAVVSVPPFNFKLPQQGNQFAHIQLISDFLESLSADGMMVIALANRFLHGAGAESKMREELISRRMLHAVLELPAKLLDHTAIPFSIIVLQPGSEITRIVDAREMFVTDSSQRRKLSFEKVVHCLDSAPIDGVSADVPSDSFRDNEHIISPARYVVDHTAAWEGEELWELGKLVSILPIEREKNVEVGFFVTISDLLSDPIDFRSEFSDAEMGNMRKGVARLHTNSLLLATTWNNLKPTYYTGDNEFMYYPPSDILAVEVNENLVDLDYLVYMLDTEPVRKQLDQVRKGGTVSRIAHADLLRVKIPLPSRAEQRARFKLAKEALVMSRASEVGLLELIKEKEQEYLDDLSVKKHNILQYLSGITSGVELLRLGLKNGGGVLHGDHVMVEDEGVSIEERLDGLVSSLKSVVFFVDNITNDWTFAPAEELDVHDLVKECIREAPKYDNVQIIEDWDEDSLVENPFYYKVRFSRQDFRELFNNIYENAVRHGFVDPNTKYKFAITYSVEPETGDSIISFENNGLPFPKGMAERYHLKGEKAGPTGHHGIGSWKVVEIAKHFDSVIKVNENLHKSFPVRIDLIMKPIKPNE